MFEKIPFALESNMSRFDTPSHLSFPSIPSAAFPQAMIHLYLQFDTCLEDVMKKENTWKSIFVCSCSFDPQKDETCLES
jgi:hypothetical protein